MNTKLKKSERQKVEDQKNLIIKLKLPKKLEQHLIYLEAVSKRHKSFIVKEALIQYLEDAEDMSKVAEWVEKKGEKYYTSEEVKEFLERKNLKEISV